MLSFRRNLVRPLLAAAFSTTLLTACYDYDRDALGEPEPAVEAKGGGRQFINLTVTVGSSDLALTRAPQGGENGDGREQGFPRENEVRGITFILADGPIGSDVACVAYAHYFVMTAVGEQNNTTVGTPYTAKQEEARYTTGNQPVDKDEIDLSTGTYYVYVVANWFGSLKKGDLLKDVLRKATVSQLGLYSRSSASADGYTNFTMSSEQDLQVDFTSATDVTCTTDAKSEIYTLKNPIVIERLAARIDFSTEGSAFLGYEAKDKNDKEYPGFVYQVGTSDTRFVVKRITPFNLYDESEYLFKRTDDATDPYLKDETTGNWVDDPQRDAKDNATALQYLSPLAADMSASPFSRTAAELHGQTSQLTVGSPDRQVMVVGYAMENTLLPTSHLKQYATGLCIEGTFYQNNDREQVLRDNVRLYGYLMHQGTADTYKAREFSALTDDETCAAGTAMNYGIVRNNIYRVQIESISLDGTVRLKMAVHDWRHVLHGSIIYL